MTRGRSLLVFLAVVAVAVAGGMLTSDQPDREPRPVAITSTAPRFTTLDDLVAASDEIVLAEATGTGAGRAITDPANAGSAVKTRFVELNIVEALKGPPADDIVLEEEAALADGTPVVVDGVTPLQVGQRGVFFLVRSSSTETPYRALVGPQGRYLVDGDELTAASDDELSKSIVESGGPALVRAIRTAVTANP